jgi:hypothetical protein
MGVKILIPACMPKIYQKRAYAEFLLLPVTGHRKLCFWSIPISLHLLVLVHIKDVGFIWDNVLFVSSDLICVLSSSWSF